MAANTVITSTLRIKSDTKDARQELQNLQHLVDNLANTTVLKTDSSELQKGVQAAKDLQKALQAAVDVDTGKLKLREFSSSLKTSKTDLLTMRDQLLSLRDGQAVFDGLTNTLIKTQGQTIQLNKHFDNLLTNLKKTAQWQISSTIIHGFQSKLQEAVGYAKDLNNALNGIQVVTGLSAESMADFASKAQSAAKALSASTLSYVEASKIYFQQGDSMTEAMQKATITMKAANISFNSSTKEMSEYLTAIWNSYQVGSKELEHYVDIMAALGAKTATSMEEISTSLQKVAATANNVGVGMEQMSAIIATASSVTRQSAETVGTAWNTILSRIGGLKLGETLEDGVDLNKYSKALRSIGVNVLTAEGQLRDMGTVIDEIGNKWNSLSKAQQSALAQTIGGARQYTQMMAFFDNYDTYEVNVKIADDAGGELEKQNQTWAESAEAAAGRVKNAWQGLYSELIDDKGLVAITDTFANILNSVTTLIDKMGGLVPLIGLIASAFVTKLGAEGKVGQTMSKLGENISIITGGAKRNQANILNQIAESQKKDAAQAAADSSTALRAKGTANLTAAKATLVKRGQWNDDIEKQFEAAQKAMEAKANHLKELEEQWAEAENKQAAGAQARQSDEAKAGYAKHLIEDRTLDLDQKSKAAKAAETVALAEASEAEANKRLAALKERDKANAENLEAINTEDSNLTAQQDADQTALFKSQANTQWLEARKQQLIAAGKGEGTKEYGQLQKRLDQELANQDALAEKIEAAAARKAELEDEAAKIWSDQEKTQTEREAYQKQAENAQKTKTEAKKIVDAQKGTSHKIEIEGLTESLNEAQNELNESIEGVITASASGMESELDEAMATMREVAAKVVAECDATIKDAVQKISELEGQQDALNNLATGDVFGVSEENWNAEAARQSMANALGVDLNDADAVRDNNLQIENFADKATGLQTLQARQNQNATEIDKQGDIIGRAKQLANEVGANGEAMEADNQAFQTMQGGAQKIKDASEELKNYNEELENLNNQDITFSDALAQGIGGITQAFTGANAAVAGFSTLLDGSASATDKVMGAFTGFMGVISAFNGVMQTFKMLQDLSAASSAKLAAMQSAETVATAANTAAQSGNAAARAINLKVIAQAALATAKSTVLALADAVATHIQEMAKLGLAGAIILAIEALVALAVVFGPAIAAAFDYDKQLKELDEEMAELDKRADELEEKSKTNAASMQKLSEVVQNTNMTLKEQVDAINEITSAYGIQVTELDVLSGRYGQLSEEVHAAMLAEQETITAELEAIHVKQQTNVQKHVDILDKKNANIFTRIFAWITQASGKVLGFFLDVQAWALDLRASLIDMMANVLEVLLKIPETIVNAFIDAINAIADALASINIAGWTPFAGVGHAEHVTWAKDGSDVIRDQAKAVKASADALREHADIVRKTTDLIAEDLRQKDNVFTKLSQESGPMSQFESEQWNKITGNQAYTDRLAEYGFRWNGSQLMTQGNNQDWGSLYAFLDELGAADWGSYGSNLKSFLEAIGADDLADTARQLRQSKISEQMYSKYATEIDAFNLRNEKHDVSDMWSLMQRMGEENGGFSLKDYQYIAGTLKGYEQWAEPGQQLEALAQLAIKVSDIQVGTELTETEIGNAIFQTIADGKLANGEPIDADIMVKVRPSAITITPGGEVRIDESALQVATTKAQMAKTQERISQIEAVQKNDKGGIIDQAAYKQLWATGYFENQTDLAAYAAKSPEQRALELRQEQIKNTDELIKQNQQLLTQSQADLESARADLEAYWDSLEAYLQEHASDQSWKQSHAYLFDEQGNLLDREAAYHKMSSRATTLKQTKENMSVYQSRNYEDKEWKDFAGSDNQEARSQWQNELAASLTIESQKALLSAAGITDITNIAAANEKQLETLFNHVKKNDLTPIYQKQQQEYNELNAQIEKGIELNGEYTSIQSDIKAAEAEVDAGVWQQRVTKLTEATTAATNFGKAMTKAGQMSAAELAALAEVDDTILDQYAQLSEAEWAKYTYEQAMKYYDEQMAFYADDKAKLMELNQQKQALTQQYYDNVKKQAEDAAKSIEDARKQELDTINNAISALQGIKIGEGFDNFSGIEKLRQSLLEVGYTAEEVDQIIRNMGKVTDEEELDEQALWENAALQIDLMLKGQEQATTELQEIEGLKNVMSVDVAVSEQAAQFWDSTTGTWKIPPEIGPEDYITTGGETYTLVQTASGDYVKFRLNASGQWQPSGSVGLVDIGTETYAFTTTEDGRVIATRLNSQTGKWEQATATGSVDVGTETYAFITTEEGRVVAVRLNKDTGEWKQATTAGSIDVGKETFTFITTENGDVVAARLNNETGEWTYSDPVSPVQVGKETFTFVTTESGRVVKCRLNADGNWEKANELGSIEVGTETFAFETNENGDLVTYRLDEKGQWHAGDTVGTVTIGKEQYKFVTSKSGDMVRFRLKDGNWEPAPEKTTPITVGNEQYLLWTDNSGTHFGRLNEKGEWVPADEKTEEIVVGNEKYLLWTDASGAYYSRLGSDGVWTKATKADEVLVGNEKYLITADASGAISLGRFENNQWKAIPAVQGATNPEQVFTIKVNDQDVSYIHENGQWKPIQWAEGVTQDDIDAHQDYVLGFSPDDDVAYFWDSSAHTFKSLTMVPLDTQLNMRIGLDEETGRYFSIDENGKLHYLDPNNKEDQEIAMSAGIDLNINTTAAQLQAQIDKMNLSANVTMDLSKQGVQELFQRRSQALLDALGEKNDAGAYAEAMTLASGSFGDLANEINRQVSSKGFSYASKYGAVTKINGILSMSAEELQHVALEEVSKLYEALENMAKNGETQDMRDYGEMLLRGLVFGLKNSKVDWQAVANEQGGNLLDAFKEALGIHSPSIYTMAMGRFLMEGLSIGFQTTEFDPGNGFSNTILTKIKNELKNVKIKDVWKELGWDEDIANAFADMDQNADLTQYIKNGSLNSFQKLAVLDYVNSQIGKNGTKYKTYDEFQTAYTNNKLSESGFTGDITLNKVQANASKKTKDALLEAAQIQVKQQGEGFIVTATDGKKLIDQVFDTEEAAKDAAAVAKYGEEKMKDYLTKGFWDEKSYNAVQKKMMDNIIQLAVRKASDGAYTKLEDYLANGGEWSKFFSEFDAEYERSLKSFENAVELSWASIKDTIKNTIDQIVAYDEAAAERYYERWSKAVEAVNKLRQQAVTGNKDEQSWSQTLNRDELTEMIRRMQGMGMTIDQMRLALADPNFSNTETGRKLLALQGFNESGFNQTGYQKYLNHDPVTGQIYDTTPEQFRANYQNILYQRIMESKDETEIDNLLGNPLKLLNGLNVNGTSLGKTWEELQELTDEQLAGAYFGNTSEESLTAIKTLRDTALLLASQTKDNDIITKDENGTYSLNIDGNDQEWLGNLVTEIIKQFYLPQITDKDINETITQAILEESINAGNLKTELETEQKNKIASLEAKQSTVQNAIKNGLESLTPAEREALVEIIGKPFKDITLDDLYKKNRELAVSADEASSAIKRMTMAINNGYNLITETDDAGNSIRKWVKLVERNVLKEDGTLYTNKTDIPKDIEVVPVYNSDGMQIGYAEKSDVEVKPVTEELNDAQLAQKYPDATTSVRTDTATEWNQKTQIEQQHKWLQDIDSDLSALDALQKGLMDTETKAEELASRWLSLQQTLDMTNPEIAQAYEHLQMAEKGGYNLQKAIDEMTTALLRSGNVMLTQNEELDAMMRKWDATYEVTDHAGKRLTKASLEAIRAGSALSHLTKILSKVNSAMGTNAAKMSDIRKAARAANQTMQEYTSTIKDLSDTEREMIRDYDNMYDSFDKLNSLGLPSFTSDLADQLSSMADTNAAFDLYMDSLIQNLMEKGNILTVTTEDINTKLANGANSLGQTTIDALQQAGVDVGTAYEAVVNELIRVNGNFAEIDWGTLVGTGGADMQQLIQLTLAIIQALNEANATGLFDVDELLAAAQNALSTFQGVQSKWGGSNGGARQTARNGYTPPEDKNKDKGGGGGDNKKSYTAYQKTEKERYHEIRDELEKQGNLLKKIDTLKSRTFGGKHLKNIEDEIKALARENQLNEEYLREAQVNLVAGRKQLAAAGATFNEDGTVNYNEYMDRITAEYNRAVDAFNNSDQGPGAKLALDAAKERYDELKTLLSEYEEDLDLVDTIQESILEGQNKISAAALEGIQYKVQIVTDLNEAKIEGLEYWEDLWEDVLSKAGDRMNVFAASQATYMADLNALQREYNEVMNDSRLTDADRQKALEDLNKEILSSLQSLDDLQESMKEFYGNVLDNAEEELEKYTNKIEHAHDVMEDYINMQQLMGLGEKVVDLTPMYQAQLDSSTANVQAAKSYLDVLKQQKAEIEAVVAETGWSDTLKQQWDDVEEHIIDAEDSLLEYTNQALTDAESLFENMIKATVDAFDKGLKGLKGSLKDLENDYAYYQTQQGWYLTNVKELFEISKLTNQIDKSIQDSTTATSKKRLQALKDQIKLQSEQNDLTEYDLQMMQLQYKHALALQALEEAKNAKSTVRLTRDENGNYGYQYTADNNAVNDAQQQVDDALQAINELAANRTSEIEQHVLQVEREYRDNLLTIAADTTMSIEERQERMNELTRQHQEELLFYQEQYGHATSSLFINQEYVAQRFGTTISDVRGQYNSDMMDMIQSTKDYATYLTEQMLTGDIAKAFEKFKSDTGIVLEATGFSSNPTEAWGTLNETVAGYQEAVEAARQETAKINQELEAQGKNIASTTRDWAIFEQTLNNVRETYMDIYNNAIRAQQAIAGVVIGSTGETLAATVSDLNGETGIGAGGTTGYQFTWSGGGLRGTFSGYDSYAAALAGAQDDIEAKFKSLQADEETPLSTIMAWMAAAQASIRIQQYLHGGLADYTGPAWVDGSKNEPELVLNANDTSNLLDIVSMVRSIDTSTLHALYGAIQQGALSMLYSLGSVAFPNNVTHQREELQQNVQISAEFPNVTDHNEIEQAFNDIINMATQYANRR